MILGAYLHLIRRKTAGKNDKNFLLLFDKSDKSSMNFELFLPCPPRNSNDFNEVRMAVDRAVHYGWDGVVLTTTIKNLSNIPLPPEPIELTSECQAIIQRRFGLCVLNDYPPFPQYTRLNLETDSQEFAKKFSAPNYSLLSITPLNDNAFKAACANSEIDIISIDLSKYDPKKLWKEVKPAISRGLYVELLYSNFIMEPPKGISVRQALFNAAKSVTFLLRGRKILLSCGGLGPEFIRRPSDVLNIAQLLQIKKPGMLTNEISKSVLAKGLARSTHAGITRTVGTKRIDQSDESDSDMELLIVTK